MTKKEWDKCFVWLASLFPQWNVTAETSASWFAEIGSLSDGDFQRAIRSVMSKNPSPFPPGVFEIKAAATNSVKSLHPGPEEAWGIALASADENKSVVWTDEIAEAQGVCWEQINAGDVVGARMAFLEKYKRLIANAEQEGIPPKWRATLGFNQQGRDEAQDKAEQLNTVVRESIAAPSRRMIA